MLKALSGMSGDTGLVLVRLCQIPRTGDGQKLLRPRTFASGATHATAGKPRRSAEIRRRSRTCGLAPTERGDAVSRAVEQFAGAVVSGRDCNSVKVVQD